MQSFLEIETRTFQIILLLSHARYYLQTRLFYHSKIIVVSGFE